MSAAPGSNPKASSKSKKSPIKTFAPPAAIVIGDGWAALGAVGYLVQKIRNQALESGNPVEQSVVWIAGTGSRLLSALPGMEVGPGVEYWQRLAKGFGIETGEGETGAFLREYRNKAFRKPAWTKAPTPELRKEVLDEELWGPERRLAPLWESRFALTLNEIEQRIRRLLVEESEEGQPWRGLIRRIESLPVYGFKVVDEQVRGVILGSGEEIGAETIIYADRWASLPSIDGLPKNLPFIRRREPASLLQATFNHTAPMGVGLQEGFYGALHKESGEAAERHVWGHFSSDGMQSFWTLALMGDEVEDNHQIAKKLRRMKNGLEKMFSGESWLPEGKTDFMANVEAEQVRFLESVIFAEGEVPVEPITLSHIHGLQFITDGYGPSSALLQVARALDLPAVAQFTAPVEGADAETERMDGDSPVASQD